MFSGLIWQLRESSREVPSKTIKAEKAFSIDSCFSIAYYSLTGSLLRINERYLSLPQFPHHFPQQQPFFSMGFSGSFTSKIES